MPSPRATLHTTGERPAIRLERRLAHPPERVWRAVTDPEELAHWFPATMATELKPGAGITFTFPEQVGTLEQASSGEVIEVAPPSLFSFTWNGDLIRIALSPDGDGCLLVFEQTFAHGEPVIARLGASRQAAGWDFCLDTLAAALDGRTAEKPSGWAERMAAYVDEFGTGDGVVHDGPGGWRLWFARDLVWKPFDDVWPVLTGGADVAVGAPPPGSTTVLSGQPGVVTEVEPARTLEYTWEHDGTEAGRVRFELCHGPLDSTLVVFTQSVPSALAELRPALLSQWHAFFERFFALSQGATPPEPRDRTSEYRRRLGDPN